MGEYGREGRRGSEKGPGGNDGAGLEGERRCRVDMSKGRQGTGRKTTIGTGQQEPVIAVPSRAMEHPPF